MIDLKKIPNLKMYDNGARALRFLLGGIGTGNISLNSRGEFCDFEIFNCQGKGQKLQYSFFALQYSLACGERDAIVLESKNEGYVDEAMGVVPGQIPGLPRFESSCFTSAYPFANVELRKSDIPFEVELPAADWDKDTFLEYCEALTVEREDGTKQYAVDVPSDYFGMTGWLYNFGTTFLSEDVAVQYVPTFYENQVLWGGTGIFTMEASENPEEAAELAVYLSSPEFVREYMSDGAIPVLGSIAEETVTALGFPQNCELYIESASNAKALQAPTQYPEVATLINNLLADIYANPDLDVQSALEAADAELNFILSE